MTEQLQEWVNALRSGRYEQARYALRTDEGHCCIGVFADETDQRDSLGDRVYFTGRVVLPPGSPSTDLLITMNDDWLLTFDQIADVLESPVAQTALTRLYEESL